MSQNKKCRPAFSVVFRTFFTKYRDEPMSEQQATTYFHDTLDPLSNPSLQTMEDIATILVETDSTPPLPCFLNTLLRETFNTILQYFLPFSDCITLYIQIKDKELREVLFHYCFEDTKLSSREPLLLLRLYSAAIVHNLKDLSLYYPSVPRQCRTVLLNYLGDHLPTPKDLSVLPSDLPLDLQEIIDHYFEDLFKTQVGNAETLEAYEAVPNADEYFCYGGVFQERYCALLSARLKALSGLQDAFSQEAVFRNTRPPWARELVASIVSPS